MGGKYKQFGPWNVKQTEQEGGGGGGGGEGVQTMESEKRVGGWLRPLWYSWQTFYTVVFVVLEL